MPGIAPLPHPLQTERLFYTSNECHAAQPPLHQPHASPPIVRPSALHRPAVPMPPLRAVVSVVSLFVVVLLPLSLCVKLPTIQLDLNHQAHAKPGGPFYAVDWDGDGRETVTLDASESHTHFFHHGPPPLPATITRYQWYSLTSGNLLLETDKPFFTADFFVGVTILKLVVTDSQGDSAEDYTYVSVRAPRLGEDEMPSVRGLTPGLGPVYGGTVVTLFGRAFYNRPVVWFGGRQIRPQVISDSELRFLTPPVGRPRVSRVYVSNGFGTSAQYIEFKHVAASGNPVKFRQARLVWPSGKEFEIPDITVIKLGPDAQYYCASITGFVHVLRVDRSLTVQRSCVSDSAGRHRSILGLAFHPNHYDPLRLYVSTSTLYWPDKNDTAVSWDNGKVEVWAPQDPLSCKLSRAAVLVSGLPVSANDHGVNGLEFLADGTLLVAVGGSTNAGVVSSAENQVPESPLSGAILAFNMFDSAFDGHIVYSRRHDPGTASIREGTVEVFAAGLRNCFGITVHSNQKVYALDNGPNIGFGAAATSCGETGAQVEFGDKLLRVRRGSYYGHPNWNRARSDPRQCRFIRGDTPSDEPYYSAPMWILKSSTNGIVEYTANRFGGKLRDRLLLSKLSWDGVGVLQSVQLDSSGTQVVGRPQVLFEDSGLSVEIGLYGEILMPKFRQKKILALVPDEEFEDGLSVIRVVPRRGPSLGGNRVLVTGSGFAEGVRIFFGDFECTGYGQVDDDGRSVTCHVPGYTYGERVVDVVAKFHNLESKPSGKGEYEYMEH